MAKVLADTHVPPALRRWAIRAALAVLVAGVIAWIPGGDDDGQQVRLQRQLDDLRDEASTLEVGNAELAAEVRALRTDPAAIEARARHELGMVYPGEIVLRLEGSP